VAAERLDGLAREIAIVSPEGTTVRFSLASLSERATALAIDLTIIQLATTIVAVLAAAIMGFGNRPLATAIFLVVSFFFRNAYFAACELHRSGQTVGKRKLGLRAISRDGGPLTGQAILARNLTRELELFLPLVALSQPRLLVDLDERLALPIACAWLALFALLPIVNREHLRFGDLLGGTVVVRIPQPALLSDLANAEDAPRAVYTFTPAQLDVYGIAELQILEQVLRRESGALNRPLIGDVSRRIRRKIAWSAVGQVDDHAFLRAFYDAQRSHLERQLIFGIRKETKGV
jgi:uncharacterized RDD family membrane protein YckC